MREKKLTFIKTVRADNLLFFVAFAMARDGTLWQRVMRLLTEGKRKNFFQFDKNQDQEIVGYPDYLKILSETIEEKGIVVPSGETVQPGYVPTIRDWILIREEAAKDAGNILATAIEEADDKINFQTNVIASVEDMIMYKEYDQARALIFFSEVKFPEHSIHAWLEKSLKNLKADDFEGRVRKFFNSLIADGDYSDAFALMELSKIKTEDDLFPLQKKIARLVAKPKRR